MTEYNDISNLAKYHEPFKIRVLDAFRKGFRPTDAGYDVYNYGIENGPWDLKNRLSPIGDAVATYIRTRPDMVAVHRKTNKCMFIELKTLENPNYFNYSIEALPFGIACLLASRRIFVLYAIFNPHKKIEMGFWNYAPPTPFLIHAADNKDRQMIEVIKQLVPHTKVKMGDAVKGSGDIFVLFEGNKIESLPDWKTLMAEPNPVNGYLPIDDEKLIS